MLSDDLPEFPRRNALSAGDVARAVMQAVELVDYAVPFGAGLEWREVRERAEAAQGLARRQLDESDADLLDMVACGVALWPGLLEDDPAQPLDHWWWHVGAIRKGTFPLDLLPKHLREIITSTTAAVRPAGPAMGRSSKAYCAGMQRRLAAQCRAPRSPGRGSRIGAPYCTPTGRARTHQAGGACWIGGGLDAALAVFPPRQPC